LEQSSKVKIEFQQIANNKNKQECPVSKASTEIMLNRVCNGKEDFPFQDEKLSF